MAIISRFSHRIVVEFFTDRFCPYSLLAQRTWTSPQALRVDWPFHRDGAGYLDNQLGGAAGTVTDALSGSCRSASRGRDRSFDRLGRSRRSHSRKTVDWRPMTAIPANQ